MKKKATVQRECATTNDARGGKRHSDAQMDRAVEAKWHDPALTAEEALRMGGYLFPAVQMSAREKARGRETPSSSIWTVLVSPNERIICCGGCV